MSIFSSATMKLRDKITCFPTFFETKSPRPTSLAVEMIKFETIPFKVFAQFTSRTRALFMFTPNLIKC